MFLFCFQVQKIASGEAQQLLEEEEDERVVPPSVPSSFCSTVPAVASSPELLPREFISVAKEDQEEMLQVGVPNGQITN